MGASIFFVSRQHQIKVEDIRDELPDLQKIVYLDGKDNPGEQEIDYSEIMSAGAKFRKEKPATGRSHLERVFSPDDVANISYTSGTTADPKGIMLSHLNYAANVVHIELVARPETRLDHAGYFALGTMPLLTPPACMYLCTKGASIALGGSRKHAA